jgi:hypothetical protein
MLWPQSLHDLGLQVHPQTRLFRLSKDIVPVRKQVYRDIGVTELDRVSWDLYLADRGVYRYYLICISSYHTMTIDRLSFPTFGLTRSVAIL